MVRSTVNASQKICVLGLGYIGLPTAALLASRGHRVMGVDINPDVVNSISNGQTHIVEPDLDLVVKAVVTEKRLSASLKPSEAQVFIVSVPTPFKENHKPDISFVEAAVLSICPFLKAGNLIILESTCPIGTTESIARLVLKTRLDLGPNEIHFAYCPERVLPGSILRELIENDRIIGGLTEIATKMAQKVYQTFVMGELFPADSKTAEMVKLSENAFRDVNIAFANELTRVADKMGINAWKLIKMANRHPRVNILNPGPGVGGHCIAVDPWFLVDTAPESTKLIQAARQVNDSQPSYVVERLASLISEVKIKKKSIALLGLAYKPNIDDLRESPAVEVVQLVSEKFDGNILVVEPFVQTLPGSLKQIKNIQLVSLETALTEAGALVVLVAHDQFKGIKNSPDLPVFDTVGIINA
jgi:UDP-N-acetyl-D-mannosaminuronic acid dehydrogenase